MIAKIIQPRPLRGGGEGAMIGGGAKGGGAPGAENELSIADGT